jgi:hypothetical protein
MKLARASAKQSPRRLEHVTPQEEGRERESAGNIVRRRRIGTRVGKKRRTDFLEGDTAPPDNQVQQIELLGKLMLYDKELSVNRNEACAFCHMPAAGFAGPVSELNRTTGSYPGSVRTRFSERKPQSHAYAPLTPVLHYNPGQGASSAAISGTSRAQQRFARSQRFAGGYRASFADWQRFPPPLKSAPLHHDLLNFVPFYSAPRRMRLRLKSQILGANASNQGVDSDAVILLAAMLRRGCLKSV